MAKKLQTVKEKNNEEKSKKNAEKKVRIKNKNNKKHFNIKKNIGRLVALIIVLSMLLATSATLIYYCIWYFK